jgi:opacity protein-like surface antigen
MKLRSLALVLAVTLLSAAAHAQSGVYLTFDAQQFTQEGVDLPAHPNSANIDRPWLYGPGYGVYYDITHLPYLGKLKTGPVVVGIDGRGDTLRLSEYGSTFNRQDGLFSIRVAMKEKFKGVTPYAQGGFGIAHTKVPFRTYFSNNFIYQFSIGADKQIHKNIDWRVVEASAGSISNYNTGYYPAGVGPNQSNYMITLATGLVFRLK